MNKKGAVPRSHTEWVAMIVIMILIYFAIYIVLIPEETRRELLGEEEVPEVEDGALILISESPGEVHPYTSETVKKHISSIKLFSTLETSTIGLANKVYVSRTIFSDTFKEFSFELGDMGSLKEIGLFFHIKDGSGGLVVVLNGYEIFYDEVEVSELPIILPKEYLRERNKLRIGAASPGWRFLSKNYYDLTDVNLIKRYKVENKEEARSFVLENVDEISEAKIEFYVSCMKISGEQGYLKVFLNDHSVYFEKISCDANLKRIDLSKDLFEEGINRLGFGIDKGDYILERILLKLDMETGYHPKYLFSLNKDDLDKEVIFRMDLISEDKKGILIVNGKRIYFDMEEYDYVKDISEWVRVGENYIKIVPTEGFEIINLEVSLH